MDVNPRALLSITLGLIAGFTVALALGALSPAGLHGVLEALLWVYTKPAPLEFTLTLMGPIVCSAVGLALAYRARFITIGSEGQILLGSIVTLWLLAYSNINLNPLLAIPASLVLGGVVGALMGLIVVLLKARFNANEILVSLMLNYAILYIVNYLASGPWRVGAFAITRSIGYEYRVGSLVVLTVSAVLALACWFILSRTKLGLMIEVYGRAPRIAETYGLKPELTLILVSLISGFTAGMGGSLMMLSFQYNLSPMSVSPGYGYMGVLVAWLSNNNPLVALLASWFFSSILVFGRSLQASGLPIGYVLAIQSIIVLAVMVARRITVR